MSHFPEGRQPRLEYPQATSAFKRLDARNHVNLGVFTPPKRSAEVLRGSSIDRTAFPQTSCGRSAAFSVPRCHFPGSAFVASGGGGMLERNCAKVGMLPTPETRQLQEAKEVSWFSDS
jgi:hypothetical protein